MVIFLSDLKEVEGEEEEPPSLLKEEVSGLLYLDEYVRAEESNYHTLPLSLTASPNSLELFLSSVFDTDDTYLPKMMNDLKEYYTYSLPSDSHYINHTLGVGYAGAAEEEDDDEEASCDNVDYFIVKYALDDKPSLSTDTVNMALEDGDDVTRRARSYLNDILSRVDGTEVELYLRQMQY